MRTRSPYDQRHLGLGLAVGLTVIGLAGLVAGATAPAGFATVRLHPSGPESGPAGYVLFDRQGHFNVRNATLQKIAAVAYDVHPFQIAGGPAWVRSDRFDIDAAADPAASPEQMRLMVQRLLAERFHLTVTRTARLTDVFQLQATAGRLGPRLRATHACAPGGERTEQCGVSGYGGHLTGTGVTMAQVATALSTHATHVVLDRTGLPGRFRLDLDYMPAFGALPARDEPAEQRPPGTGPSLSRALDEQLGLTLVPGVAPVSALWIEDVGRPEPR